MTEAEWLGCTDPKPMLEFLRGKASDRKLRLFACACCRRIWHLLLDERSRNAVEVAERYSDSQADKHDLDLAYEIGFSAVTSVSAEQADAASAAFVSTCEVTDYNFWQLFRWAAEASGEPTATSCQATLLRDIFGNPFRPLPPLPHAVLAWNDRIIPRIAEGIYEERRMPEGTLDNSRLAILHDALLDAGCDNEELLTHLRSGGQHVRGCWAIDLLLDKE